MQYKTINVNFNVHIPKVNFTLVGLTFGFLVLGFAGLNIGHIIMKNSVFMADMTTSIIIATIGTLWIGTRLMEESSLQYKPVTERESGSYPALVPVDYTYDAGRYGDNNLPDPDGINIKDLSRKFKDDADYRNTRTVPTSQIIKDIPPLEPERKLEHTDENNIKHVLDEINKQVSKKAA